MASVVYDVAKLVPSLAWLVVCLVAIPSYARIGWVTPVVCAVYSAIVAILATYDIFMYQSKALHEYVPLMTSGDFDTADQEVTQAAETTHTTNSETIEITTAPSHTKWLFTKVVISMISSIITVTFTVLFLVVAYAIIDPEKHDIPCDGECENCPEDPNCSQWIADVEKEHPITNICPPARPSADTDATFSCKADGFWMIVTAVVTMGWLCAIFFAYKRRGRESGRRGNLTPIMGEECSIEVP
jgi:hypothetical protein